MSDIKKEIDSLNKKFLNAETEDERLKIWKRIGYLERRLYRRA